MYRIILAVIIVCIVILTFYVGARASNYVCGFWVGEDKFLEKSSLSDMQLYIAPDRKSGYLIVVDDDGDFIANQPVIVHFSKSLRPNFAALKTVNDEYKAKIAITKQDIFPTHLSIMLSTLNGTMTLYDGKKIYAHLTKEPHAEPHATPSA